MAVRSQAGLCRGEIGPHKTPLADASQQRSSSQGDPPNSLLKKLLMVLVQFRGHYDFTESFASQRGTHDEDELRHHACCSTAEYTIDVGREVVRDATICDVEQLH